MGPTQVAGSVLATLSLLACDGQGTAPVGDIPSNAQLVNGLELRLSIDPTVTAPGDKFTATFTITNRRDTATTLTRGCVVLARGVVYRAGQEEDQSFIGTGDGCYTAISTYQLDVGESVQQVWNVSAARQFYRGDLQFETVLASNGDYLFRVAPDVIKIDQESARLPELEVAFRVN